MQFRDIIVVCSENLTNHIKTCCEQNVEFVDVKHGCKKKVTTVRNKNY
jgi:hypothetical protein